MKITTCQIGKTKVMQLAGWTVVDITIKSGKKCFAPIWEMVMGYKKGTISWEEYTSQYMDLMRKSYRNNPAEWENLIKTEKLCLACYCRAGDPHCHRHLLKQIIKTIRDNRDYFDTYIVEEI